MKTGRWGDPLSGVDAAIQPDARLPKATALLTLTEVQDINTATLVGGSEAVLGDDVRMVGPFVDVCWWGFLFPEWFKSG